MNELIKTLSSSSALLLSVFALVVTVLMYFRKGRIKFGHLELDFSQEQVVAGRDIHIHGLKKEDILQEPAHKQYALMQQYHAQGLAQAKISFWFSLIFASIGFTVIIVSLLTMDNSAALTDQGRTLIGLVSGTIIDAVSTLFFIQSNKARHLMTEYFDKLRIDRKFDESLQLSDKIPDTSVQSRLKVLMALNFAGVSPPESVVREILSLPQSEREDGKTHPL